MSLLSHDTQESVAYASEDGSESADDLGWLWQQHTAYSHHVWLAFRVACGATLVLIPLLVKPHSSDFVDELRQRKIVMRADIAMYMYTVYLSTGQTVELAWSALIGTFLSVFNMWILQGFFPGGSQEDSPWWVPASCVIDGAIFTFLILYLNFAMNTRIFALSSFVFHWMTFLCPSRDDNFSSHFKLSFESTDAEFAEFKAATIGCMLAILTSLLPWPFWAYKNAEATAERLYMTLDVFWQESSRLMCAAEGDDYKQDTVSHFANTLREELDTLAGTVADSYWEQFCRPRSKTRRKMLAGLHSLFASSFDDINNVWYNCLAETYGDMHNRFMGLVGEEVDRVVREAGSLLRSSTRAACSGHIEDNLAEELMRQRSRTQRAIAMLTKGLMDARDKMQLPAISKELIDEHCFCLNLCTYGREVFEFAEALVQHARSEKLLPGPPACESIFTGICNRDQLSFAVRNFITIALGLFVGWHGYANMFRKYDAGIACTLAILLSKYIGSAMSKNLQRIQGVVIGTVFGQLVYALLAKCSQFGYVTLLGFNFAWVWVTFFVYFHIPAFSTIAVLMGVFGTSNMVGAGLPRVGCWVEMMDKKNQLDILDSYYDIVNVCTALFLGCLVDMVLGKSAKVMAAETLLEAWRDITEAISSILDAEDKTTKVLTGKIFGKIAKAKSLGQEAGHELSLGSSTWRAADFDRAIDAAMSLRIFLGSLESTASQGVDGGEKDPDFLRATQLDAFAPIKRRLLERLAAVEALLDFRPEPFCRYRAPAHPRLDRWPSMQLKHEVTETEVFLEEAGTVTWEGASTANFSLENDGPSQVCTLLSGVAAMQGKVRELHRLLQPKDEGGLSP